MRRTAMNNTFLTKTTDRKYGVDRSLANLDVNLVKGKGVLLKPNFNTADITPGSTHNDTLEALIKGLWSMGAKSVTLGERSYPPLLEVMEAKGVLRMLRDLDVKLVNFDDLPQKDWVPVSPRESHWQNGFRVARPILESECLISTCCLKTHQYGGIFSMALKLAVGVVPTTRHGFSYMTELHESLHQRKMIAEINQSFSPAFVVLDGIDTFTDGGPMTGTKAKADVFLTSTDRVAIDAVGVAILKSLGSNQAIMNTRIFDQEQIARAAELNLGVSSGTQIDLVPTDDGSREMRDRIAAILTAG
jgi:uncharacterized protein (DUF362 family)